MYEFESLSRSNVTFSLVSPLNSLIFMKRNIMTRTKNEYNRLMSNNKYLFECGIISFKAYEQKVLKLNVKYCII